MRRGCNVFCYIIKEEAIEEAEASRGICDAFNIKWSGFVELLADLINKYAVIRDIKNLPELLTYLDGNEKENVDDAELFAESIEKTEIA